MGKLTAVAVKAALKSGAPVRLMDGDGLRLVIDSAGRGYWILRYRREEKDIERSLGRADGVSLSNVRAKAREARADSPPARLRTH